MMTRSVMLTAFAAALMAGCTVHNHSSSPPVVVHGRGPVIVNQPAPQPPVVVTKAPPPVVVSKTPPPVVVVSKNPPPAVVVTKSPPPVVVAKKAPPVVAGGGPAVVVTSPPPTPPSAGKGPPAHAKAHGLRRKYTYLYYPDAVVYYAPERSTWFWIEGDGWRASAELPDPLRSGLGSSVSVDLSGDHPREDHATVRAKYPGKSAHDDTDDTADSGEDHPGKGKSKDKDKKDKGHKKDKP